MKIKHRSAFSMIEFTIVIVVLSVLAAFALSRYTRHTAARREEATKMVLGAVRSAIASFYADSVVNNGPGRYPTLTELQTTGIVFREPIPRNLYSNNSRIVIVNWTETQPVSGTNGWNYDPEKGRFWGNSLIANMNRW